MNTTKLFESVLKEVDISHLSGSTPEDDDFDFVTFGESLGIHMDDPDCAPPIESFKDLITCETAEEDWVVTRANCKKVVSFFCKHWNKLLKDHKECYPESKLRMIDDGTKLAIYEMAQRACR